MDELWQTVTHARLRARQGDLAGARRILERLVVARPHDPEARALREALAADGGAAVAGPPTAPATGGVPADADPAAGRRALRARLADRARREWGAAPHPRRAAAERIARWLRAVRRGSAPSLKL